MAQIVETVPQAQNSLDDFIEAFRDARVTLGDDEALLSQANLLAGLHGNRTFLKEALFEKLEAMWGTEYRAMATSQTINLGNLGGGHYLRMVFWPCVDDEFYERCDNSLFYYGRPHDHNFSFLTLGYDGPGYASDYFDILEDTKEWQPGKSVRLIQTDRKQLINGRVMFYRRHFHVHSQLPPEQNSISINIMGLPTPGKRGTQFIFDQECKTVQQVMQNRFNPVIFDMAAAVDSARALEITRDVLRTTNDDYVMFYAQRFILKQEKQSQINLSTRQSTEKSEWLQRYANKINLI